MADEPRRQAAPARAPRRRRVAELLRALARDVDW
jgi:hypothetical protein